MRANSRKRCFERINDDVGIIRISRLKAVRSLRSGLIEAAQLLVEGVVREVLLVLDEPEMTEPRILGEWERTRGIFLPEIVQGLNIVMYREGDSHGLVRNLNSDVQSRLNKILGRERTEGGILLPAPELYYEILKVLVHQWFRGQGPMTSKWIAEFAVGCSYPTVADALDRLGPWLTRHSDRRVELNRFPREEWAKLLAVSDRVRSTMRYVVRSGIQARSPRSLMMRLLKTMRTDIAVGGVTGAKHYFPNLNITGDPRLDISIHCPGREVDLSFVEKLDPALVKAGSLHEPAHLVIHMIRRKKAFFGQMDPDGVQPADPVECLLDLHEVRLEAQAKEFLEARIRQGEL
jgi:hypothetical protein